MLSDLWRSGIFVALLIAGLSATALDEESASAGQRWTSSNGQFHLMTRSLLEPIMINRMHSWVLHLESTNGLPVSGAQITMTGGMPDHNHGLATRPVVTPSEGDGEYLVEGIRFHMRGHWVLTFTITSGSNEDIVVMDLEL